MKIVQCGAKLTRRKCWHSYKKKEKHCSTIVRKNIYHTIITRTKIEYKIINHFSMYTIQLPTVRILQDLKTLISETVKISD